MYANHLFELRNKNTKMHKGYAYAKPDLGVCPRVGLFKFMGGNIKTFVPIPLVELENLWQPSVNQ